MLGEREKLLPKATLINKDCYIFLVKSIGSLVTHKQPIMNAKHYFKLSESINGIN